MANLVMEKKTVECVETGRDKTVLKYVVRRYMSTHINK